MAEGLKPNKFQWVKVILSCGANQYKDKKLFLKLTL